VTSSGTTVTPADFATSGCRSLAESATIATRLNGLDRDQTLSKAMATEPPPPRQRVANP
jgi:hypothetical protein